MAFSLGQTTMQHAALPPLTHLQLRLDRAVKVFNRAMTAIEREQFTHHHYHSLRAAHDEISSLSARFRDAHWGKLDEWTTWQMSELSQDMEAILADVLKKAFNSQNERTKHPKWPNPPRGEKLYTCTRTLEFQGRHYRKELPSNNPAAAQLALDQWEKHLIGTLVPAESRA